MRFEILGLVLKVCCSLIGQRVFKEEEKYHLRFQRLNYDENFFESYDYNIPKMRESNISTYGMIYNVNAKDMHTHL